jgi:hypothetical protein
MVSGHSNLPKIGSLETINKFKNVNLLNKMSFLQQRLKIPLPLLEENCSSEHFPLIQYTLSANFDTDLLKRKV